MKSAKSIIDVRTPGEFVIGHVKGSINIPLGEIHTRIEEIKKMQRPVVLCCASGNRSGQATTFLQGQGVVCENGGSWLDIKEK